MAITMKSPDGAQLTGDFTFFIKLQLSQSPDVLDYNSHPFQLLWLLPFALDMAVHIL